MYWKIIKDYLAESDKDLKSNVGMTQSVSPVGRLSLVRCLDDDREVYYEARADDDGMESLFDWTMHDAGCTILQVYDSARNEWKDELA